VRGVEDLDRHVTLEIGIAGDEDEAKGPLAKLLDELVLPDATPRRQGKSVRRRGTTDEFLRVSERVETGLRILDAVVDLDRGPIGIDYLDE